MSTATPITSAFGATSTACEVAAGHDLSGRRAIVTGAATGIGVETARALAEAGAEVTLAVRNLEAGQAVAAEINRTAKGPKASVRRLDLSNQASVRGFVDEWGGAPVDILINNAGVMACPLSYTDDDLEMQIGANHFGHYQPKPALMAPAMAKAAKSWAERAAGRTELDRPPPLQHQLGRSALSHARLRQVGILRPVQDRQFAVRGRLQPPPGRERCPPPTR